jgi:hypothetical protein
VGCFKTSLEIVDRADVTCQLKYNDGLAGMGQNVGDRKVLIYQSQ